MQFISCDKLVIAIWPSDLYVIILVSCHTKLTTTHMVCGEYLTCKHLLGMLGDTLIQSYVCPMHFSASQLKGIREELPVY